MNLTRNMMRYDMINGWNDWKVMRQVAPSTDRSDWHGRMTLDLTFVLASCVDFDYFEVDTPF